MSTRLGKYEHKAWKGHGDDLREHRSLTLRLLTLPGHSQGREGRKKSSIKIAEEKIRIWREGGEDTRSDSTG